MSQPIQLTHENSPFAITGRVVGPNRLSVVSQSIVDDILRNRQDFKDHQVFHYGDVEEKARQWRRDYEAIRPSDLSWYHAPGAVEGSTGKNKFTFDVFQPEEERVAFLWLNYCRFKVATLRETMIKDGYGHQEASEILQWYQLAQVVREQIVDYNLALVLSMAKRVNVVNVDFSDLVSEGNMALLRSIDGFDIARGWKFSTYACRGILSNMYRLSAKSYRYQQLFPVAHDPDFEVSDHDQTLRQEDADWQIELLRGVLKSNSAQLTKIEVQILELRFGFNDREPLTLQAIGDEIGLTKERARQIQEAALEKLRPVLNDRMENK